MLAIILKSLILIPVVYLAIAFGLIASQWPTKMAPRIGGLDFSGLLDRETAEPPETSPIEMRDDTPLPVRTYGDPQDGPMVVLIHGSGWHGMQFDALGRALADQAFVVAPDLRGHGVAPERRGDIDYIGQFEADVADVIDALRQPAQEVIVLGHSSGGGLVVRMAGGPYRDRIDRAILMAPFLKYNAPTMRPNAGDWSKTLTRRIIGLSMLNNIGIKALNNLTIIQFAMPQAVLDGPLGHTATTAYSYRLNTSYAPRSAYLEDIAALPPFLLIAGREDEAFVADQYEPLLSTVTDEGTYHLIDGVGHLDVVNDPYAVQAISDFVAGAQP